MRFLLVQNPKFLGQIRMHKPVTKYALIVHSLIARNIRSRFASELFWGRLPVQRYSRLQHCIDQMSGVSNDIRSPRFQVVRKEVETEPARPKRKRRKRPRGTCWMPKVDKRLVSIIFGTMLHLMFSGRGLFRFFFNRNCYPVLVFSKIWNACKLNIWNFKKSSSRCFVIS